MRRDRLRRLARTSRASTSTRLLRFERSRLWQKQYTNVHEPRPGCGGHGCSCCLDLHDLRRRFAPSVRHDLSVASRELFWFCAPQSSVDPPVERLLLPRKDPTASHRSAHLTPAFLPTALTQTAEMMSRSHQARVLMPLGISNAVPGGCCSCIAPGITLFESRPPYRRLGYQAHLLFSVSNLG